MGRIMKYKINKELNLKTLAAAFKKAGRVQVKDALEDKSADTLSETIEKKAIWLSVFLDGEKARAVSGQQAKSLTNRRQRDMMQKIYFQARDSFQYVHFECPLDKIPDSQEPDGLKDADVFFKSDGFRDFLRGVAGVKTGELEDVRARWLQREQFMTDSALATNLPDCKLWFSMDVTRKWRPHWGGHLNFLDSDGEIEQAWSPGFNRLNIYAGGTRHSISYVTPFHDAFCLSVCGRLV